MSFNEIVGMNFGLG